jgi:GT2 family glycosyltransferase
MDFTPIDYGSGPFPTVLIAVINWNGRDHILECLASIEKLRYPKEMYQVLVIDNCSTDGSQGLISQHYPGYRLITNSKNIHCARAENQAISRSLELGVDYLWLLNNDVVVDRDSLEYLIRAADTNDNIGVLAPVIYDYGAPEVEDSLGYDINFWTGRFKRLKLGHDIFKDPQEKIGDVDTVQGCSVLTRTSVFKKMGSYHPGYEAYFEESEFHTRIKNGGFRVVTVKDAKVWHKKTASYNRIILRRAYLLLRNLILFEWRNAERKNLLLFIPYFLLIHLPYFILYGSYYALKQKIKAFSQGLKN